MNPLTVLALAPAASVIALADALMPDLPEIEVVSNRGGIVMMPVEDTSAGAHFHVGEVMMSEARVRLVGRAVEGYGACLGRNASQSLAIAVLDAAHRAGLHVDRIQAFCREHAERIQAEDEALARDVERTRVVMETF